MSSFIGWDAFDLSDPAAERAARADNYLRTYCPDLLPESRMGAFSRAMQEIFTAEKLYNQLQMERQLLFHDEDRFVEKQLDDWAKRYDQRKARRDLG